MAPSLLCIDLNSASGHKLSLHKPVGSPEDNRHAFRAAPKALHGAELC